MPEHNRTLRDNWLMPAFGRVTGKMHSYSLASVFAHMFMLGSTTAIKKSRSLTTINFGEGTGHMETVSCADYSKHEPFVDFLKYCFYRSGSS